MNKLIIEPATDCGSGREIPERPPSLINIYFNKFYFYLERTVISKLLFQPLNDRLLDDVVAGWAVPKQTLIVKPGMPRPPHNVAVSPHWVEEVVNALGPKILSKEETVGLLAGQLP